MYNFDVYRLSDQAANISELGTQRDWLDETPEKQAYRCFPMGLMNNLGWGISFPEDITFIWDGDRDPFPDHVKILEGEKYAYTHRANNLITFETHLMFRTPPNVSLWVQPVPNLILDGAEALSVLLSTSFLKGGLDASWRITKANVPITVKAGTPVISVLPIDLTQFNNSTLNVKDGRFLPSSEIENDPEYSKIVQENHKNSIWGNYYRNGTDHKGNKIGEHQLKKIILNTVQVE